MKMVRKLYKVVVNGNEAENLRAGKGSHVDPPQPLKVPKKEKSGNVNVGRQIGG